MRRTKIAREKSDRDAILHAKQANINRVRGMAGGAATQRREETAAELAAREKALKEKNAAEQAELARRLEAKRAAQRAEVRRCRLNTSG